MDLNELIVFLKIYEPQLTFFLTLLLGYLIYKELGSNQSKQVNSDKNKAKSLSVDSFSSNKSKVGTRFDLSDINKNNLSFFGAEGMKSLESSFIIVVGIGGVGSHALMSLVRSGVKKLRIVDYDVVTLSSLNRHAFAFREDVGQLKVNVSKKYLKIINPYLEIECIDDAFTYPDANDYIAKGNPDYVIDCIDDLDAKIELLYFCKEKNIKVISSMGAGAKKDPTTIRISDLVNIQGDKMARRIKYHYKKKYNEQVPRVVLVYSEEKTEMGLSDLEHHQKENPEDYRVNENERVRSLPVFASLPAIFGQSIASIILCDIAGLPIKSYEMRKRDAEECLSVKKNNTDGASLVEKAAQESGIAGLKDKKTYKETINAIDSLYKRFLTYEEKIFKINTEGITMTKEDFEFVLKAQHMKSIFDIIGLKSPVEDRKDNKKQDESTDGKKLNAVRWNLDKDVSKNNLVLMTVPEWNAHIKLTDLTEFHAKYGDEILVKVEKVLASIK